MTNTSHLNPVTAGVDNARDTVDLLVEAVSRLSSDERLVIDRLLEMHLQVVSVLERIGAALGAVDQLDDLRDAQLTMLKHRVELLEQHLGDDPSDLHSRKV